jgi:hypothetical protein
MLAAVAEQAFPPMVHAALEEYVLRATPTLVNQRPSGPTEGGGLPRTS